MRWAPDNSMAAIYVYPLSLPALPPSLAMHIVLSFVVGRIPSQRPKEQQSLELSLSLPFPVFPYSNSFPYGPELLHALCPANTHTETLTG